MAGNRADVLRAVHSTLEKYTPLRTYLGHTVGATSVAAGARIVGDDIRLEELPLPFLVLSFAGGDALRPGQLATWLLDITAYATDVFEAATVIDHLETLAVDWVRDSTLTQPLNRFLVTGHERLDAASPAGRLIAVRINLEISWIS